MSYLTLLVSHPFCFTKLLIIELPQAANRTACKQLGSKVSLLQICAVVTDPALDYPVFYTVKKVGQTLYFTQDTIVWNII